MEAKQNKEKKSELTWPPPEESIFEEPDPIVEYALNNSQKGDPEDLLKAADYYCWNLAKYRSMGIGDVKGGYIDEMVKSLNPTVALECGALYGYSAIRIARLMKPGSRFYSLEIDPNCAKLTEQMVEHAGLADKVKVILGDAHEVIPKLKENYGIERIDLVLIDNDPPNYKKELIELLDTGLIQKGTVVVADNVTYPEASDYVNFVRKHEQFESTLFETHLQYRPHIRDGMEKSTYLG